MENLNQEPQKSRIELGLLVSNRIQLVSVCLIEGFFRRNQGIEGVAPEIRQRRSVEAHVDEKVFKLQVATRLVLNAFPEGSESENSFMEIEARFLLTYSIDSLEDLTKEHFDAFGEYNGIFNVWPYWREFVQSSTVRMGLPPLTVPVYRISPQKSNPKLKSVENANVPRELNQGS
jgi:hypothetical protein